MDGGEPIHPIFEVRSDGTLEVIQADYCGCMFNDSPSIPHSHENDKVINRWTKKLSQKDISEINKLVKRIQNGEQLSPLGYDATAVFARIGTGTYSTDYRCGENHPRFQSEVDSYTPKGSYVTMRDREAAAKLDPLQELTYKLIEISPFEDIEGRFVWKE